MHHTWASTFEEVRMDTVDSYKRITYIRFWIWRSCQADCSGSCIRACLCGVQGVLDGDSPETLET